MLKRFSTHYGIKQVVSYGSNLNVILVNLQRPFLCTTQIPIYLVEHNNRIGQLGWSARLECLIVGTGFSLVFLF